MGPRTVSGPRARRWTSGMTERSYRIGLIRGDGIGPEVLSEALRVLEAVSSAEGFRIETADYNLTIVRENTEGLYAGKGEVTLAGAQEELATEVSVNTTQAVRRVTEYAFELAAREGRSLTMVHKVNVLERAGSLWQRVFNE